jgi:hypothetical protein
MPGARCALYHGAFDFVIWYEMNRRILASEEYICHFGQLDLAEHLRHFLQGPVKDSRKDPQVKAGTAFSGASLPGRNPEARLRIKVVFPTDFGAVFAICAALLTAPGTIGCSSFSLATVTPGPVATSVAQYRAYGASIVHGTTLSDPATQSFPSLVARFERVSFANNAIPGDQACDVPTTQVFPQKDFPTLAQHPTYSLLVGTNDYIAKGAGSYEAIYMLCQQAIISWLGVPAEYKVLANGSGVTTRGPGGIDRSNNWNSWTTGGPGASISFTITTSKEGPIYAWPRIDDNNPATYTYSLDGVILGSASVQTSPRIATKLGGTNSLGFLRFPSAPAGKHVVTFTQTSTGTDGVSVVGIASPKGPSSDRLPTVLVGTITYMRQDSYGAACNSADGPCEAYIQDEEKDVELFSGDGLKVRLFDTRKFMHGTSAEMNDELHPNEFGHLELSHAVEAVW